MLNKEDLKKLNEALYFAKMGELKNFCGMLSLPEAGTKVVLIERIMTFITTGKVKQSPRIPATSRASHHPPQKLHPSSLMLYGSYKNDAITRAFFKNIIGSHFHFTAFGIDWLNDRWLKGNPPTYQEFANYWIEETARRKKKKAQQKKEWAYINFMQTMGKKHPDATKKELMDAWKKLQAAQAAFARNIIEKISKTS